MKEVFTITTKRYAYGLFFFAAIISVAAWYFSYQMHWTLLYNDAMSHLDLARLMIDNKQPGITQMGGVWLPLNHILALSLVWNNWAWHSGFAGSFFSMISYVISVVSVFLIVHTITRKNLPALLGALVFALNDNMLYLQTTPLTEPLYIATYMLSLLFFVRWIVNEEDMNLILLGLFGFLQVLIRYDGWFIVTVEALLIGFAELMIYRRTMKEVFAKLMLYGLPVAFGMGLWFIWNLLVFHDPLFFMLGHYSAHEQQFYLEHHSGLITKKNMYLSIVAYMYAVMDNVGLFSIFLGGIGGVVFTFFRDTFSISFWKKALITVLLLSPIIFNIISLYEGFSTLNVPELHWNPSPSISGQWFNVRYGILGLPFASVMVGVLLSYLKKGKPLVFALILLGLLGQSLWMYQQKLITIVDGQVGSSSFANTDVANALKSRVKSGESVLLSTANYNAVAFMSGLDMNHFVHEGVSKEWTYALTTPQNYVKWIVMANGDIGEPAFTSLVKNQKNNFLAFYKLSYRGAHADIYELKSQDEFNARRVDQTIMIGSSQFRINGVNSYDLAYKSSEEIDKTFSDLHSIGVNTIRFWAFGDGNDDGFQPTAGNTNEDRFRNMDQIMIDAKKYGMKVIPVLVNNWEDYGGKDQYLQWIGKGNSGEDEFYTNPKAISLFKNYVNHVLSRRNTISSVTYANDSVILAWDIMNEPRIARRGSEALSAWTQDIATYIKSQDHNHLVMIGAETNIHTDDQAQPYTLCDVSAIDICSVHVYIYDQNTLRYKNYGEVTTFLQENAKVASKLKKPIVTEETGISKNKKPFGEDALDVLHMTARDGVKNGYSGILLWNWSQKSDESFGFSPSDSQYNLSGLKKVLSSD